MTKFTVTLLSCLLIAQPLFGQQQIPFQPPDFSNPQALEQMFDAFASQAGPMGAMFGKLSPEQVQQLDAIDISLAEERQFGDKVLEAYLKNLADSQTKVTAQGRDVQYLAQLVALIKPLMTHATRYRKIQVRVIETPAADAYAIAGGELLVTRGLLDTCESEAAMVGVLSHELSHLDRGHLVQILKQTKLMQQPDALDANRLALMFATMRPFRPEQESEADADATKWMMNLGYDPRELVRLLSHWAQQKDQQAPWMKMVPSFVKTHPDPAKRAGEILQLAEQLQKTIPNASFVGTENLQKRTPKPRIAGR